MINNARKYGPNIYKDSGSYNLLIADSQARELEFDNFDILSVPGARIGNINENFYPSKDPLKIIVLLIGGNDTYDYQVPSTVSPADIAIELRNLADPLCKLANSVFVLAVPHHGSYRKRASAVNSEIQD